MPALAAATCAGPGVARHGASTSSIRFAPPRGEILKLFLVVLALIGSPALAHQVVGVADGDTLTVLDDGRPLKIRLANIDAPEKAQAFGQRAKQSLSELCFGKDATYRVVDVDRYGRTVAEVACAGVNVNHEQVARGMAWVYVRYNKDPSLLGLEEQARNAHLGLWSDATPTPPWLFRRGSSALR
jgi:micrococcal nuclease